jgi:hypothetical protein
MEALVSASQLYDTIGRTYTATRCTEPRIAARGAGRGAPAREEVAMLVSVRRYLALVRRRPGFVIGMAVVLLVAVICEVLAHTTLIWDSPEATGRQLAGGFGDAFVIAFVIALLVDPVALQEFASKWGHDIFWAIFSPDSPQPFRDTLLELAKPPGYVKQCTYELEFSEPDSGNDGFVRVDWRISLSGVSLDQEGFRPTELVFVGCCHDGSPSHYRSWSFKGEDTARARYNEKEMDAMEALSVDKSGRTVLDQSKLSYEKTRVPLKGSYETERHITTTRWRSDSLPLWQPQLLLDHLVIVRGPAIDGLEFSAVQLGRGPLAVRCEKRPGNEVEFHYKPSHVAFPGQVTLLTWRPKDAPGAVG